MQARTIDHVVLAVHDLAAAARTWGELGFTLTPPGHHDWGTMNQLIQFAGGNFIELLAIEHPERISEHARSANPPRFGFGAHNRDYLTQGEGMSMLVMSGQDSGADVALFRERGLTTYAPFDFSRAATLPDGSEVEVSFSLAFVSIDGAPRLALFTCHNRYPEYFYRAAYQRHANGATAMPEVLVSAPDPESISDVLVRFSNGISSPVDGGCRIASGLHRLSVLTPTAIAEQYPQADIAPRHAPELVGLVVEGPGVAEAVTPSAQAGGTAILWQPARA